MRRRASTAVDWIARAIVRGYPRAWRVRYEAEVHALIEDAPVTLRQLADLVRGCGSEWRRAALDCARAPRSVWTSRLGGLTLALAGTVLAGGVARVLQRALWTPPDLWGDVVLCVYPAVAISVVFRVHSVRGRRGSNDDRGIPARDVLTLVAAVMCAAIVANWAVRLPDVWRHAQAIGGSAPVAVLHRLARLIPPTATTTFLQLVAVVAASEYCRSAERRHRRTGAATPA